MQLHKAEIKDYDSIHAMYWELIDLMRDAEFRPMWEKNVYPTDDELKAAIENGTMYFAEIDGNVVAAMVLNHNCSDGYSKVRWAVDAPAEEISVIHMLGVLPTYHGKGIAKFMVESAQNIARENKQKVIRLDVLEGNLPAEKLYLRNGFEYRETLKLFYEDTGWTNFKMYECIL